MLSVTSAVLFDEALNCLVDHKRSVGSGFRGRFVQLFLGLKFFQNSVPSMYSGAFITTELLQSLLDDLFSKSSRPATECVLSVFEKNYLARTGLIGPGNSTAQNTWRNNFNLQKGVGCYAPVADLSSPTFLNESRLNCRHIRVANPGELAGARCTLCLSGAAYRSENHRKWLRIDASGGGYAVVDLQNHMNFIDYLAPDGKRIPLWPLVVALYHDADAGLSVGARRSVSMADFAADFNFTSQEMSSYFDPAMTHPLNAKLARSAAWAWQTNTMPSTVSVNLGAVSSTLTPPAIGTTPVLSGSPTLPPSTNSGWEAEQHVAATLRSAGWTVHEVSRQQLGYDLFAQRGSQKRHIEVKSSLGMCAPTLTAREWQQANYYAANYVLAVVENFNATSQNVVYWVPDPANRCSSTSQATISHSISRSSWTVATVPMASI
ncbi:DUF3883 domain-containing protein [Pseudoxanthomonas mexicana]|uniref:DUF3883 domain-containing protein n=1 Tax=Pseudoxanthomonas mexicana TaxID=128785 RepID=UPI0028A8F1A0|nr:DUF3883 domain-containing protein [Pseudoxanthomonas mexicana]